MFTFKDLNMKRGYSLGVSAFLVPAQYFLLSPFLGFAPPASASHFRGGQITWTMPDPVNSPYTVLFTVSQLWRAAKIECVEISFGDGASSSNHCATAS